MTTRMVFLGGYLGAGKTTLAYHLARALRNDGLTVAVVMNDQGNVLVDTQFMKNTGVDAREVTGACFCTKFDEFVKNARSLVGMGRVDVIIAEPIGTSTSILASVVNPLKSVYGSEFSVAPLVVVLDSHRFVSEKARQDGDLLAPRRLIPQQQLNEAEVLVLSKQDLLSSGESELARTMAHEQFPEAELIEFSSRRPEMVGELVKLVRSDRITGKEAPKVDQRIFAGEKAALGWYSSHLTFSTTGSRLDVYDLTTSIMKGISETFGSENIAHAKVLVNSETVSTKISLVEDSMQVDGVRGGRYIDGDGELILNARIAASPDKLRKGVEGVVNDLLTKANVEVRNVETACFVPRPEAPKHSMP